MVQETILHLERRIPSRSHLTTTRPLPVFVALAALCWVSALLLAYGFTVVVPEWAPLTRVRDLLIPLDISWIKRAGILLGFGKALAVIGIMAVAACGAGTRIGSWFVPQQARHAPFRLALDVVVGLGVVGLTLCGLGYLSLLRASLLAVLMLWYAVLGAGTLAGLTRRRRRVHHPRRHPLVRLLVFLSLVAVFGHLASSLAPEVDMDSLKYHLAKAHQFVMNGAIRSHVTIFDGFPSLWELLLVPPLMFGGEPAANLMNPLVVLLTALLLWRTLERAGPLQGTLAATLYLTSYAVNRLSCTGKNDLLVALFVLAAFVALQRAGSRAPYRWFSLGGCLLGLALVTKYTALLALVALLGLLVFPRTVRRRRYTWLGKARHVFLAWALVSCCWGLRNWYETGNPCYPQASRWFPHSLSAPSRALLEAEFSYYVVGSYTTVPEKLRAVWSLAMVDRSLLLPAVALPACVVLLRSTLPGFPWALGALTMIALWTFGPPQGRFLIQALPLLCGAIELSWSTWALVLTTRRVFLALSAGLVCLESVRAWGGYWTDRPARLSVACGLVSSEGYRRARLTSYDHVMTWANRHLPRSAKVLIYGDVRVYPLARQSFLCTALEPVPVLTMAGQSRSQKALERKMRQARFTHILYDRIRAISRGPQLAALLPRDDALKRWADYWRRHAELIYAPPFLDLAGGGYYIYKLDGTPSAATTLVLPGIEGWLYIPHWLHRQGRTTEAQAAFRRIQERAGDFAIVQQAYVATFESLLTRSEISERLKRVERQGLRSVWTYTTLARCAEAEGDLRQAMAYRRKAEALKYRPEAVLGVTAGATVRRASP